MANLAWRRASSANEMRTVRAGHKPNPKLRTREYLTAAEVERLIKAAPGNRYGHRAATLLLVIFRHGLRASEACSLRWADIDLERGNVHAPAQQPASPLRAPCRRRN
jgi:type 1 fimbriae regulatory protein FimB/type 1 fimbriae regulatory protein FimE